MSFLKRSIVALLMVAGSILVADAGFTAAFRFFKGYSPLLKTSYRVHHSLYHHDLSPCTPPQLDVWGQARYIMVTNSLGFRDRSNRTINTNSLNKTILIIGDSFTEGIGVNYEDTFVGLAESAAEQDVEILNAAVSSYSPIIYYRKIKYLIEKVGLHPHRVIVYLDISDIEDESRVYRMHETGVVVDEDGDIDSGNVEKRLPTTPCDVFFNNSDYRLTQHFTLFPLLVNFSQWKQEFEKRYRRYQENVEFGKQNSIEDLMRQVVYLDRGEWTVKQRLFEEYGRAGLDNARNHMNRLHDLLNSYNIDMTLAVYPWPTQIWYNDLESRQVKFWQSWAQQKEVEFMNYFPDFVSLNDKIARRNISRYYIAGDVHFNKQGHQQMSKRLIKHINQLD